MGKDGSHRAPRTLVLAVVLAGAAAVLGTVAFWPRGDAPEPRLRGSSHLDATVTRVDDRTCRDPDVGGRVPCQVVEAELTSGPDRGDHVRVRATPPGAPDLAVGDEVVLLDVATGPPRSRYSFVDLQRSTPMLWLLVAFVAVVVAYGRWQGVRALLGLGAVGLVLLAFLVPSLLRDQPVVPVVLAATVVAAFVALYLAHGINLGTTVALAGTVVALAVTTALAFGVAAAADLTGAADDRARSLRVTAEALDLRGLLVAGIVVGALGVLDDVTVSQVSIVSALRRADPMLSRRVLYRQASRMGRDHVASTVNTLVLAYAGASLPLLVLFAQGDQPVDRLLTNEVVAVEVVRMLVGSIGLVASVPATTALAAAVLGPGEGVPRHDHGWGDGIDEPRGAPPADPRDGRPAHAAPTRRRRRRRPADEERVAAGGPAA